MALLFKTFIIVQINFLWYIIKLQKVFTFHILCKKYMDRGTRIWQIISLISYQKQIIHRVYPCKIFNFLVGFNCWFLVKTNHNYLKIHLKLNMLLKICFRICLYVCLVFNQPLVLNPYYIIQYHIFLLCFFTIEKIT